MKSFRCIHVFNANIARSANVTSRIRRSLIVVHDRIPKIRYAASPAIKRFTSIHGAQGRIRTSVPRKEEQIYSLPALTTHPPVQKCRLLAVSGFTRRALRARKRMLQRMMPMKNLVCTRIRLHTYTSFGNASLWSAVGNPYAAAPRKLPYVPEPVCLINAGAGEGI
jgi:hypothetical protein